MSNAEQIVNRVAKSPLRVIDLEDFYPSGSRILFDIKDWLYEGFVLREKDFRNQITSHNWLQYQDAYIALTCSSDAIVPIWAYMLITLELEPFAKSVIIGDLEALETRIFQSIIADLDIDAYKNAPVIIKGCSNKPIPKSAYLMLTNRLKPFVKSIMYGEACSAVPLFKKKA
ncbi:DUF2480 family protein [Ichthyenterobacterium sp. W332]|uniref:DUF2480 family protein n=1 Tax=Microcosmobacter mediterraneus TaxID=3075607 RepID=A0ABU2YJ64_9FLAO|nr:DUF2480 family protein [Ichthyenterobacterium sp. W332]MDT0558218.1 DUF2480 family protein [Ichthyenterobacterium sp. W332]